MKNTLFYSNLGAGQQCCYNEQGNLLVGPPKGGFLARVHVEVGVPVFSHFFYDIVPFWDCCLLSDNCRNYFERRLIKKAPPVPPVPPVPGKNKNSPTMLNLWWVCKKGKPMPKGLNCQESEEY